ncbi:FAD-dependent oxidoreductase [Chloroflexota bacterium]
MVRVVVVGGGASGCAAAFAAVKAGAEVILLERTDLLLGAALVAGHMAQGGRFCLDEEARAMGGGELLDVYASVALTRELPSRASTPQLASRTKKMGYTYNCGRIEPAMREFLQRQGIKTLLTARAVDAERKDNRMTRVKLDGGEWIQGDAFIDCTGTSGGLSNCIRYGSGCAMCPFLRCPTFGDRVSIATKAGARELNMRRPDGAHGIVTCSLFFYRDSLSPELQETVRRNGLAYIDIKGRFDTTEYIPLVYHRWAFQGFDPQTGKALDSETGIDDAVRRGTLMLVDNGVPGIVADTGFPYIPYQILREIPELENARLAYPQGYRITRIKGLSITPREGSLRVQGFENVFCAGEKSGAAGVNECTASGLLAGHNAVRAALGKEMVVLPRTTVSGDYIAFVGEKMETEEGLMTVYGTRLGVYLKRMIELGLYLTEAEKIKSNIQQSGLSGMYARSLSG